MSYVVVIPSNNAERLERCLFSIWSHHLSSSKLHQVYVVDDGALEPSKGVSFRSSVWIDGIKPFIYARNVNLGIQAAGRDDVVILGDDVLVETPNAFDLLAETSKRMNVAAVSPGIIGPVSNPHQRNPPKIVRQTNLALAFVCVYLPREWLDRVGPLDERFDQYGCEDVDWCWRAGDLGGRLLVDGRVTVRHNDPGMESAFRSQKDVEKKAERAKQLLREKWPQRFNKEK